MSANTHTEASAAKDDITRLAALLSDSELDAAAPSGGKATPSGAAATDSVEHGIWSGLVSVITHPVFQQVVGGVVNQVLTQRGLSPAALGSLEGVQNGLWSPPFHSPPFVLPLRGVPFHHGVGAYTTPEGAQQGLWSGFTNILQHPLAQTIIKGAVDAVFTQHSINPSAAADIQQGLFSDIGAILKSPAVHNALTRVVDTILTQHGLTPVTVAQYPEVQQGVFSGLVDILKNPTFQSVVKTVVNGALTQHGIKPVAAPAPSPDAVQHGLISILGSLVGSLFSINPNATGGAPFDVQQGLTPDVQQGLFSILGSVLGSPIVHKALTGVIDSVLTQRGLNPQTTAQYPEIQQGIWSSMIGILQRPEFLKIMGSVVSGITTQHGLNSKTTTGDHAEIQQGILSGVANIFKHPVFQQIAGSVVNSFLTQHGLDFNAPSATAPLGVQQGLFSDLGSALNHPLVRQTLKSLIDGAFIQRGLNPAVQTPEIQQGIWSTLGSVFNSPIAKQLIGAAANAAIGLLSQNALDPNAAIQHGLMLGPGPVSLHGSHPDIQQGLVSGILGFLKTPIFQQTLGTVINSVLTQHSLNPATAGTVAQHGLFPTYAPGPVRAAVMPFQQYGLNPDAQSLDIQHGFWSSVGDFFKNPTTQKVITTAADVAIGIFLGLNPNDAPVVHGLNPVTSTFDVQQGLLSDFGSVLSHPLVRQTLKGLIDGALVQRGLNPAAHPDIQQGIWSTIGSVFKSPLAQQVMGAAAKAAVGLLTQNGINPNAANAGLLHGLNSQAGTQPDIQLGLLSGALGFISHPIFQKILGNVINGVLPRHSLNATGAAAPLGAQQGLAPHFGSYLPRPMFQHI
ncbi:hypothetical protein FPV67DRAFT_1653547 [Lyophyllum atratum]|nr:hypothetical protein FPV67DRAFT_1653547 [Lyophyllum atratum]